MNTIIDFFTHHWILSSAFIVLLVALIANEWALINFGIPTIDPKDVVDFMNHSEAKIVDVRSQTAFQDGHILGSLNIPLGQMEQKLKNLEKYKDNPIILTCNLGNDAGKAANWLQKNNFKKVFILQGGLNAWRTASLPLTKKS